MSQGNPSEAVEGFVDQSVARTGAICPECDSNRPRRLERKGFLETKIYPIFGYYPWICVDCKTAFLTRKRYRRKSKRQEEYASRDAVTKG